MTDRSARREIDPVAVHSPTHIPKQEAPYDLPNHPRDVSCDGGGLRRRRNPVDMGDEHEPLVILGRAASATPTIPVWRLFCHAMRSSLQYLARTLWPAACLLQPSEAFPPPGTLIEV